jgi:hypothetical protein
MRMKMNSVRVLSAAIAVVALGALVLVPTASAHTGQYARFNNCPSTNPTAFKCLYSETIGGKVVLGKKTVPIVNKVILQGGYTVENEAGNSTFIAASNGAPSLVPTPQPVPGGLSGLVNCKEISLGWLRASCESIFENGLTGVNSTLELALPANQIVVSQEALGGELGVALKLPVKVHLENPLLGSSCYIGSSTSPIIWNLTSGATKPPAGTAPIHGFSGEFNFIEGGEILELEKAKLVENNWPAPGATGCGGWPAEYILDPIIEASVGVPSAAGKNVAILENNIFIARAKTVNMH